MLWDSDIYPMMKEFNKRRENIATDEMLWTGKQTRHRRSDLPTSNGKNVLQVSQSIVPRIEYPDIQLCTAVFFLELLLEIKHHNIIIDINLDGAFIFKHC